MPKSAKRIVADQQEAINNIERFQKEVEGCAPLQDRIGHFHAWYAVRSSSKGWIFAPSKFVGYFGNSARDYLASAANGADGRVTEKALRKWFVAVEKGSPFEKELGEALEAFLGRFGKQGRKGARINLLAAELNQHPAIGVRVDAAHLDRVSSNPQICGGRPCIKGTRVRISDILDMLAGGAAPDEIVEDFPYLSSEDIVAALTYAARASDHRVIRAA